MNEHELYNYKMVVMFGNNFGKGYYSKNMVLIRFYEKDSIIFIPSYDTNKYPFPPLNEEMHYIGPKIEDRGTKRRINAFTEAPVIFFEDNKRAGKHFKLEFEYDKEGFSGKIYHNKYFHIIFCVDSEMYKKLYQTLRKDFYSHPSGYRYNRENSIHNKALQFIEEKLMSFKNELPEEFKNRFFRKDE
ncbi:hypothetical protein [Chryseobacterium sp.]|uniref:hypothetical protein n=1 Tax=Chryseobacterium sp. TaxID=1871047 RepID=UPI0028513C07|nr:hypothetical protein [Chryseobacterium sp.]MDR3024201.1 hypothetical protein [Chryseobacterium sp.]